MFNLHNYQYIFDAIEGGHQTHSTNVTVLDYCGVNKHMRIDVKSSADCDRTNMGTGLVQRVVSVEKARVRLHGGSAFVPFVVTVSSVLGPAAMFAAAPAAAARYQARRKLVGHTATTNEQPASHTQDKEPANNQPPTDQPYSDRKSREYVPFVFLC